MRVHANLAAPLLALACVGASAQQNLKPGLWEISNKTNDARMDQAMAQMQQQLAAMPPEQRKQMEAMMAQRGVKLGAASGGGMAVQICMTREMVERNELPTQQGDCRITSQSRSGNTIKMAFACSNPPSTGEGEYTVASPEAYSTKMKVSTTVQGKPETMNMEGAGKWLSADCGSVKPVQVPKK